MPHFLKPIKIGNNCFIGARSIILPGTVIEDNCVVGAGAVVKGLVKKGSIVAGNPAKEIKSIEEYVEVHEKLNDYIVR